MSTCIVQPLFIATGPFLERTAACSAENGLLENMQVAILGIILLIGLTGLFRQRSKPELKLFSAGLVLLSLNMILRELDVEDMNVPAWVIWIGSGTGRDLLLTAAWLGLLGFCAGHRRLAMEALRPALAPRVWIWLAAAAVLLLLGLPFDHKLMEPEQAQLAEELFECAGYLALLPAAFAARRPANNLIFRAQSD
jgi:hypothetical protein